MKSLFHYLLKFNIINKIYTYFYYALNRRVQSLIIDSFDKNCPLEGKLRENGYLIKKLAFDLIFDLTMLRKGDSLSFNKKHAICFNNIIEQFTPDIEDYLGDGVRIDVICVTEIDDESHLKNVSQSWHTDNVGHRLKLFICIEGDGSFPTYFVPNSNLVKYSPSLLEDLRMIGKSNLNKLRDETAINHSNGTIAVFDTNGLHRGGYEASCFSKYRRLVELEFSNRNKSNALMGKSAIGPRHYDGQFQFDDDFYSEFKFKKFLDHELIKKIRPGLYSYGDIS